MVEDMAILLQHFEDLPGFYIELAEIIGKDNALKFAFAYEGASLYVPKIDKIKNQVRNECIKKEFDGSNHKALAREYGVTEVWLRSILKQKSQISSGKYK